MAIVRWTQHALDDLRDIHDFIARDSPRAAESLVDRLLTATERLATFPESGRVVPEFPELTYREIIVSSYRALYRQEENAVWIAAVIHGRRHLDREPGDI
jgi:addiction module RelE/StbE family toxin